MLWRCLCEVTPGDSIAYIEAITAQMQVIKVSLDQNHLVTRVNEVFFRRREHVLKQRRFCMSGEEKTNKTKQKQAAILEQFPLLPGIHVPAC